MTRSQFPRVFELIHLIEDRGAAGAYFRDFETLVEQDSGMARVWSCRELEFRKLDEEAWSMLKASAAPYLIKSSPNGRGWSQLISVLNEARGYIYLSEIGCTNIRFIPRVKKKGMETPDLIGELNVARVLCEVKTVQISDSEIQARRNIEVRSVETSLTPQFLNKLDDALDKARNQLFAYEGGGEALRIVFMVLYFDDWVGAHKRNYYNQIDAHLAQQDSRDYEIVFFNERTVFHEAVSMKVARVVNESG